MLAIIRHLVATVKFSKLSDFPNIYKLVRPIGPVNRGIICLFNFFFVLRENRTKEIFLQNVASLQGLDYFSATGAKAFDELEDIVEKLGDEYGKGLKWAKETIESLKKAKRYLKGDYKVFPYELKIMR